jgi:hypothetical protein
LRLLAEGFLIYERVNPCFSCGRIDVRETSGKKGENFMASMRRKRLQTIIALSVFVVLLTTAELAKAVTLYGVTASNQLIRFDSATPNNVTVVGTITGLQSGENILGIDFRPATGQLYALGSTGRLYIINKTNASATLVAPLSVALNGTDFGFDFNPVPDRLRIVSNTGQNLRVNPNDGSTIVDGTLNPGTPSVTAAGYTNNFAGATSTTLYVIDTNTDQLLIQNPPNNGTLNPVGSLGVDASSANGFDIFAGDGIAYAALTVSGTTSLYTINLMTGAATLVGPIGSGSTSLRGLAADMGTTAGYMAFGVTMSNNLISFNTARPAIILSTLPITGLQTGENIVGIDFRPATGQLYALGSNSRLYIINPSTGAATFVASLSVALNGTDFGVDFNPVPDRLRVVSNTGQNLRINVADGSTIVDGTLNPGTPTVTAAAYTNSFPGATSTTLYVIDTGTDQLLIQNPPNNGTLNPVGPLGFNATNTNGFDISTGNNTALAVLQVGSTIGLYSINLANGSASFIGPVGNGMTALRGFAVVSGSTASGSIASALDFDGDRRQDIAIFRPSNNNWFILRSSTGNFFGFPFGLSSDILTPGDYDGDGRSDVAVFRPSEGRWYILRSSDNQVITAQFGLSGDQPVQRDYDGDGKTDLAVARNVSGSKIWYILNSSNNSIRIEQFGLSTDVVVPGDYDGDGRFDIAVRRGSGSSQAIYYMLQSTAGFAARQFGLGSDIMVPGDYDGDGRTDLAVVRPGTNWIWYVLLSSNNSLLAVQLGGQGQTPAQADYDGDGRTDIASFDPASAAFYYIRSSNGSLTIQPFGQSGDIPVASHNVF